MEGRQQLPAEEVQAGRKIASLRIHVERAIGRIRNFAILTGTLQISLARLSNQIVCVCAFISNFLLALVPPPTNCPESDVEEYFQSLADSDNYDADTESGDDLY